MRVIGLRREETLVCWIIHFLLSSHTFIFHFIFVSIIQFVLCLHIFFLFLNPCSCRYVTCLIHHPSLLSLPLFPVHRSNQSSLHTSISSSVTSSFDHVHSSVLHSRPSIQLLGLGRRRRPGPGSAPDGDGRHRAAPGRHCAGCHQPARHDR